MQHKLQFTLHFPWATDTLNENSDEASSLPFPRIILRSFEV